jgi:prepilin-type N-terminal cleavage/methylation domain-containing protein
MNNSINKKNKGGFTLIELLLVIAIIGLLSVIVFASLDDARKKARNSKRNQLAVQYINALDLYRDNTSVNDRYPMPAGGWTGYYCIGDWPAPAGCWGGLQHDDTLNAALSTHIPGPPKNDPPITASGTDISGTVYYCLDDICSDYALWWYLEGETVESGGAVISSEVTCPRGVVQNDAGAQITSCEYRSNQ